MSTQAFKNLIQTLAPSEGKTFIKHGDVLDATREVMRTSLFRKFDGLTQISAEETRHEARLMGIGKDDKPYPYGLYSFDRVENTNIRRYIFILLTSANKHVYVKLMLNDADLSLDYYRLAHVQIVGKSTWHFNMAKLSFEEILSHLELNGAVL